MSSPLRSEAPRWSGRDLRDHTCLYGRTMLEKGLLAYRSHESLEDPMAGMPFNIGRCAVEAEHMHPYAVPCLAASMHTICVIDHMCRRMEAPPWPLTLS